MFKFRRFVIGLLASFVLILLPQFAKAQNSKSVCEFIAEGAGQKLEFDEATGEIKPHPKLSSFYKSLEIGALTDINGDGQPENLGREPAMGTAGGYKLTYPDFSEQGISFNWHGGHAVYEKYIRWGYDKRWLEYEGHWFGVIFQQENLQSVRGAFTFTPEGPVTVCGFSKNYINEPQIKASSVAENYAISSLLFEISIAENAQLGPILHEEGWPLTSKDIDYLNRTEDGLGYTLLRDGKTLKRRGYYVRSSIAGHSIDFNNDGQIERFASIAVEGSGGRGCGATTYELLPDAGRTRPHKQKYDDLARLFRATKLEGCSTYKKWHIVNDKTVLYIRAYGQGRYPEDGVLVSFENGEIRHLAKSQISIEHTVEYDRSRDF